jgi:hypothetical protein
MASDSGLLVTDATNNTISLLVGRRTENASLSAGN